MNIQANATRPLTPAQIACLDMPELCALAYDLAQDAPEFFAEVYEAYDPEEADVAAFEAVYADDYALLMGSVLAAMPA